MERYSQRIINIRSSALRWLAIINGVLAYLPIYFVFSKNYFVLKSQYYVKDLILFISSIIIVIVCLFVWKAVYKQFKEDRSKLGFSADKNGVFLTIEIFVETLFGFLSIFLLHMHI